MNMSPIDGETAFAALFEAHLDAVRAYAWRRDPATADDVVAETFLVAWRRLGDVPDEALPWLIAVARNVRRNELRSGRRRSALVERLAALPVDSEPAASPVLAALAELSERDREVLLLAAWEGLDRDEIAAALGCTRANVSLRLFRARRRLAGALNLSIEGATDVS
jgi:RNA polymerase sigma factor (sigma-70 family)